MNIRCSFCQTPYTLSRVDMLDALQAMDSKKLTHYDAHCPRCKRATPIPRQRMEMFLPNWREALKTFEADMKEHPQPEAPAPAPVSETDSKPEPAAQAVPKPRSRSGAKPASPEVKPSAAGSSKAAASKSPTGTAKGKKTTTQKSK